MNNRVLVVEDDGLIAEDLCRTLRRFGYEVPEPVASSAAAIEAVGRTHPSLVLMDITLPGPQDGIFAARSIRRQYDVPIVFLTAHTDDNTILRAATARPQGYIVKPFNERDLRVAVEIAIHKHDLELRASRRERWFETTLHSIPEAVIVTSENGTIAFMNHVAEQLIGTSAQRAVGQQIDDIVRVVSSNGTPTSMLTPLPLRPLDAWTLERADTARVPVEVSVSVILDVHGAQLGVAVVMRSLVERMQFEEHLRRSDRLSALGTMAAGLCHEINNPLAYTLANLGTAIEKLQAGDTVLDRSTQNELLVLLRESLDGTERIRRIADEVKPFAKSAPEALCNIDITVAISNAVKLVSHGMKFPILISKEAELIPEVQAREAQLTQVFVNLLVNAAQAMKQNESGPQSIRIEISQPTEHTVEVAVIDSGCGIASEHLPRVFDPFFTTRAGHGGTGLGLSICHKIITSLDGQISIESVQGVGTTLRVVLPASGAPFKSIPPPTAHTVIPTRSASILIVDDDEFVALAIARQLKEQHTVHITNSGADAIEKFRTGQRFDLVLCDLMMPDVSGAQVFDAVSTLDPPMSKRFVIITGGAYSESTMEFLRRTQVPCLSKPFDKHTLTDLVNGMVSQTLLQRGSVRPKC